MNSEGTFLTTELLVLSNVMQYTVFNLNQKECNKLYAKMLSLAYTIIFLVAVISTNVWRRDSIVSS